MQSSKSTKPSGQILIDGAKKIISIEQDPYSLHDFVLGRMMNIYNYDVEKGTPSNNGSAFTTLWCMMYDIVLPLMQRGKGIVEKIADGIHTQWSATHSKGYFENLSWIFAATLKGGEFEEDECAEQFNTLMTLGSVIKEYEVQFWKEQDEEEKLKTAQLLTPKNS